jgi:hypothetical protein
MQAGHSVLVTGFTARAAQAAADMIIEAARSVPGARLGGVPVTHVPAAVTVSGYCQM